MDLDFGLLQQINADIDGFPVRFDDDMDILDLDNVLHASVPGSFQDFAAWLADNSGTMASARNPESSGVNADCRGNCNTLGLLENPQQHFDASNALDGGLLVSEPNLPISNLQHQHSQQQQQQQQSTHVDVMRQNSTHSVHSQPSPGSGHHAHHAPPTAHDSFRSAHSCSAAGLPEASLLLQQTSPQQQQHQQLMQQQQQLMQQQGSGVLASGWALPSQQQPQQQQTQQQQQAAAASAALSAAASKAQQLLMSPSSGFGAAPAAATAASTAGFLAAQQPQHGAGVPLALGGASFSTGGFPAISPAGNAAVLLSPHGAVLQPTLLIGGGGSAHQAAQHGGHFAAAGAMFPAFSVPGMGGMALGPQHMQQGFALHGAHAAAGLALHQNALHSLVGHGVTKHTAMERQQKARKRNTVASLEAELTEKLGHLQLLSAENEMLKLRAGVLEATVQNREDQMRVVWEHGPPTFPIDCPEDGTALPCEQQQQQQGGEEEPGSAAAAAAAADGGCEQQQKQKQQGLGIAVGGRGSNGQLASMWDDAPAAAAAVPVGPLMPTTPSAKAEPANSIAGTARTASNCSNVSAAAAGAAAAGAESPSSSSNCGASGESDTSFDAHTALLPLPQQKDSLLSIKRMTDVDVIKHWKNFLQEVTIALVQLQREESAAAATATTTSGGGAEQQEASSAAAAAAAAAAAVAAAVSPAEQRVRDLVDKACYLVRTSQTLNPSAYCRLFGRHLDTGETLPYNDSHWRNVVAVLGLSKDQVTHILACAELYFSSRAKLQAEQRALQLQLKAAELTPLDLLGGDADNPLRPWLERLGSNLKREHNLRIMLNSYVWGRIFTHVQKAKAAVYSHPLYVDIHALVCVMCEDALAAAGAPRGAAAQHQQQQQQILQQQQQAQLAAAYAACQQQAQVQAQQQQYQQQLASHMHYMAGMQHGMM